MFKQYEKDINKKSQDLPEVKFTENEIKNELISKEKTKNITKITWFSFALICMMIFYAFFNKDISDQQVNIFTFFGGFLSGIVITYIGGSVYLNRK